MTTNSLPFVCVGDLLVVAKSPYFVGVHDPRFLIVKGNHGYDPKITPTMNGIFYAYGPNIQPGRQLKSFENIHIYPMILRLLDLPIPSDIDGDVHVLDSIYTIR